ncbi:uncharacterized protein [Miscanthus floridulus]|uniref:uncharacterized protein n=1 Tax=Miscanthus floridulus TaxID=154761 RepID=UPI003458AB91
MEFFPDGGFVRLQNRQNRKYIHADGDWVGVTLRPLGRVPSLEAVWRAEHWVSNRGHVFLLLQNAAYGRYLSLSVHPARPRHLSRRVIQRDFDDPNLVDAFLWRWRAQRVDPDQDYVRLRQFNFHLRADGRYLTWNWKTRVTGDLVRRRTLTTMMQWTVHAVAATPLPLPLPVTPPEPQIQGGRRGQSFWALWRRAGYGPGIYPQVPREIRHVRANDEGEFDQNHYIWPSFISYDQTVFDLRIYLGQLQDDWNGDMLGFTLCIRPGSHGQLMPLVTHLPRSRDPLRIVVFRTGSPAAAALVYPQIYAPAP